MIMGLADLGKTHIRKVFFSGRTTKSSPHFFSIFFFSLVNGQKWIENSEILVCLFKIGNEYFQIFWLIDITQH